MSDKDEPSDQEIADVLRGLDPQPNTLVRNFEVEFERVRCCSCDISFYVTKFWHQQRQKDHSGFYCPNGHALSYPDPEKKKEA